MNEPDSEDVSRPIGVGVDGGGTTTDVLIVDRDGTVLASASGGGANPQHNPKPVAKSNVRETIERALDAADRSPSDVAALTAGFAGLNDEADREWAEEFATVPGLECDPVCVNDAVIAHAGALGGDPGIVAICGTGSIVYGVTADGHELRNYDFDHYARAAARHLGGRALHKLLAGQWDTSDRPSIDRLLDDWEVPDLEALRTRAAEESFASTETSGNALDAVAPTLTDAAASGSAFAREICNDAVEEVAVGIRIVGGYFHEEPIQVAPMGSVLRSRYMRRSIRKALDTADREYRTVDPAMNGAGGAALRSLERIEDCDVSAAADRLAEQDECKP